MDGYLDLWLQFLIVFKLLVSSALDLDISEIMVIIEFDSWRAELWVYHKVFSICIEVDEEK